MNSCIALFPGSFDPITVGHVDVIERGLSLFDRIVVAVGENADKRYMFDLDTRLHFIRETFKNQPRITVSTYSGLTTSYAQQVGATHLLRGLRNPADFEFEKAIAHTNRVLTGIETVFLLTAADTSFISSSIVRDVMRHQGDFQSLVPPAVHHFLSH